LAINFVLSCIYIFPIFLKCRYKLIGIDDPEIILRPLANQLRPTIISSWMEKKKALLTNNAEKMKHLLDNLQKKLDEV